MSDIRGFGEKERFNDFRVMIHILELNKYTFNLIFNKITLLRRAVL